MKKASSVYALVIFWSENCLYVLLFWAFEVLLVPWVYVKVLVNASRTTSFGSFLIFAGWWVLIGPFARLYMGAV